MDLNKWMTTTNRFIIYNLVLNSIYILFMLLDTSQFIQPKLLQKLLYSVTQRKSEGRPKLRDRYTHVTTLSFIDTS